MLIRRQIEERCPRASDDKTANKLPPYNKNLVHNEQKCEPKDMKHCSQVIMMNTDNLIAFVKEKGKRELPGGKIKVGETPLQAVIRETLEEAEYELDGKDIRFVNYFVNPSRPNNRIYTFIVLIDGVNTSKISWEKSDVLNEGYKGKVAMQALRKQGIYLGRTFLRKVDITKRMMGTKLIIEVFDGYYMIF